MHLVKISRPVARISNLAIHLESAEERAAGAFIICYSGSFFRKGSDRTAEWWLGRRSRARAFGTFGERVEC